MTSPSDSDWHDEWSRAAKQRSRRFAEQTRKRVRREQRERERERLRRLGADPAWLDRVFE
jgi:hypothetical protein